MLRLNERTGPYPAAAQHHGLIALLICVGVVDEERILGHVHLVRVMQISLVLVNDSMVRQSTYRLLTSHTQHLCMAHDFLTAQRGNHMAGLPIMAAQGWPTLCRVIHPESAEEPEPPWVAPGQGTTERSASFWPCIACASMVAHFERQQLRRAMQKHVLMSVPTLAGPPSRGTMYTFMGRLDSSSTHCAGPARPHRYFHMSKLIWFCAASC